MSKCRIVASTGISIISILTLIFIVLKLLGKISWTWWWVISPFWIPVCILAVVILLVIILVLCVGDTDIPGDDW